MMTAKVLVYVDVVKALLVAAECQSALSMSYNDGIKALEKHGFNNEDRFDLPATDFADRKSKEALKLATDEGLVSLLELSASE